MTLEHVLPAGMAGFRDRFDNKAKDWFRPISELKQTPDISLLGAPLSKTSISHSGAFMFPQSVRAALGSYSTYDIDTDTDLTDTLVASDLGDISMHVTDLGACHQRIYEATAGYWATYPTSTLFLLGGDHSITAPSIRAFREHVKGDFGVIHFDAHHDMRNLEDGGPSNGTPFRTLLDNSWVDGSRMIQIGLRNFANAKAYTAYARSKGVTLVTMNRLVEQGLSRVIDEAIEVAGGGKLPIYVTFDLDVLDQAFAPGVPAPGPGGMDIWTAISAMRLLGKNSAVKAFDWVCADPTVDLRNLTSRVAATLMLSAAVGIGERKTL